MATDTDVDELLNEEDELKKKPPQPAQPPPQQGPIGKPMGTTGSTAATIGTPITPRSTTAPAGLPEAPAAPAPAAPTSTIGTPIPNIMAPRPAGERAESTAAQGPPQYHGAKRALDTLAGSTTIGQAIERAGGFGTQGYRARLGREEEAAKVEEGQLKAGEEERKTNATTEEQEALAAKNRASADMVTVTLPNGSSYQVPQKDAARLIGTGVTAQSRENVADITQTGANTRAEAQRKATEDLVQARTELAKAQTEVAKAKADPNNPDNKRKEMMLELAEKNYELRLKTFEFNYEPEGLSPQESGMLAQDEAGKPIPLKSPESPTAQTRTRGQMAAVTSADFPAIYAEIDKLAAKIGPGVGRWNQFWVNKAGINDPDFAHLDSTLGATASGLVVTHFGARGGGLQYIEQMKKDLGEAQSPEDLKARLAAWDHKMAQYAAAAGIHQGTHNPATSTLAPPHPNGPGMKWQNRTAADGSIQWREIPVTP